MIKKFAILACILSLTGCNLSEILQYESDIYNLDRVTKKDFGTYVRPGDSPVDPEVFTGFHTALDIETYDFEQDIDIEVRALCEGSIVLNKWAQGYGGVVAQICQFDGKNYTVVYGHLNPDTTKYKEGERVKKDDLIGVLGDAYSYDTDNERKHLHLGIHKGLDLDIRGYVQNESELDGWINPREIIL